MAGMQVVILIALGWVVFNWIPGFVLLRAGRYMEAESLEVIKKHGGHADGQEQKP